MSSMIVSGKLVLGLLVGCLAGQTALGAEQAVWQADAADTTARDAGPASFAVPVPLSSPTTPATSARPATLAAPEIGTTGNAAELKRAQFGQELPSEVARHVADWALDSGDPGGLPFVIIDKTNARVFVFDAKGQLRGAASALLGLAIGDDAVPGIGQRKLSTIRPEERTTSAGRFVASLDRNLQGKEILWVDYDIAMSMHPVVAGSAKERRADRLATPSPKDNRISYGCINVPVDFFAKVVSPAFTGTDGIVYVLPETRPARQFFGTYDVEEHARARNAPG